MREVLNLSHFVLKQVNVVYILSGISMPKSTMAEYSTFAVDLASVSLI